MQVASMGRSHIARVSGVMRRSAAPRWNPPRRVLPLVRATPAPPTIPTTDTPLFQDRQKEWEMRLLYDGECPLCLKEISMLKNRDQGQNKIEFVDIATPEYEPADNAGISYGEAMGRIHAILPDGKVIQGVEVFRRCYELVGLGWVYALTALKPIERFVTVFYNIWAKLRLPLTGRSNDGIDEMTYWNEGPSTCADDEYCELNWDDEDEEVEQKEGDLYSKQQ